MTIDNFEGQYRFLSNFHESPVEYNGLLYRNAEGAYQAQKTVDLKERYAMSSLAAGKAKKAGRKVTLRAGWDDNLKVVEMVGVVHAKFTQNEDLRAKLLETGTAELIEGNWWKDTYWGVCDGVGQNMLGKILMAERKFWKDRDVVTLAE